MALQATVHHVQVALSDVDRGVYETLDLRLARHPSESMRYLVTRLLAYCLSFEEGIAFSKGGISSTEEPPIAVRDLTGILIHWIDIGNPSMERLHKASKSARRVSVFTDKNLEIDATVHKADEIAVVRFPTDFLDALELERNVKLELTRNEGHLYATLNGKQIEGVIQ
jgi:uncharacterized protein YaeQ